MKGEYELNMNWIWSEYEAHNLNILYAKFENLLRCFNVSDVHYVEFKNRYCLQFILFIVDYDAYFDYDYDYYLMS